ncbi:MAG: S8 family serine peptidase [candidate division WOR-3 bacterium]|nr:MAG: S8 family serine peptidase [candidate division WOR-3 bacterium]
MKKSSLTAVLCVMAILQVFSRAQDEPKKRIEGVDDLPRHTYKVEGTVTELYNDQDAFRSFRKLVRADIENDLAVYEIEDRTTLRGYYNVLLLLDVMDADYENALEKIHRIRELHDKQARRLTSGIVTESVLRTYIEAGPDRMFDKELFVRILSKAVDTLPWDIVQESIEQLKGRMDLLSENFILSIIQGQFDPVVERAGHISNDIAERLISLRFIRDFQLPLKEEIILVFEEYIAANQYEKEDIWQERNVILSEKDDLRPVIIAIWDTGIDTAVFPDRLYVNPGEEVNGIDDDLNGFIDDVNGIAYDVQEEKTTEILYPLGDAEERLPELKKSIKGFMDIQTAIESPEAAALKSRLAEMQPEELKLMLEDMTRMALYAHGTHVAGIAVEGNPLALIMVVRFTIDYHTIPMAPTIELSTKMARVYRETIEYMKTHGVRVVNMSWGGAVRDTERDLEANGIGETAEERARMAREMFDIEKRALYEAMKNAPEILFVNAAGNDNDDVAFEDHYPAAFDLPNLLVVGAVDKAGDVTSFTSFGKTVDVYANGYEVESYLPGGDRLAASGTSASSPMAVNLAAKLLALDPSLEPSEVIELIHTGADPNSEGLLLINPKRSVQLLGSR